MRSLACRLPVHLERHERVAASLDGADQPVELGSIEQQLARADRIGNHVRRRRRQRGDMRAEQVCLRILDEYVRFLQLRAAGAQALDLPSLQRQAGLVGLLDEIVVPRLAVLGDRRVVGALVSSCS